ncbi:hypothetical protein BC628DRAFT_31031 [Trametes gibbosa]|nr:hypothetical protein BC628DRAFT_31031 [Trametes gibbosa]
MTISVNLKGPTMSHWTTVIVPHTPSVYLFICSFEASHRSQMLTGTGKINPSSPTRGSASVAYTILHEGVSSRHIRLSNQRSSCGSALLTSKSCRVPHERKDAGALASCPYTPNRKQQGCRCL